MIALLAYVLRKAMRDRGLILLCGAPSLIIGSALLGITISAALHGKPVLPVRIDPLTTAESMTSMLYASVCLTSFCAAAAAFLAFRRDVAAQILPLWVLASRDTLRIWFAAVTFGTIVCFTGYTIDAVALIAVDAAHRALSTALAGRLLLADLAGVSIGVVLSFVAPNGSGMMNALLLTALSLPCVLVFALSKAIAIAIAVTMISMAASSRFMVRRCAR